MSDITAPLDALLRAGFVSTSVNGAELTERDIRTLIAKHREDAATIAALREVAEAAENAADVMFEMGKATSEGTPIDSDLMRAAFKDFWIATRTHDATLKGATDNG